MKISKKKIFYIIVIIMICLFGIYKYRNIKFKKDQSERLIGTYVVDMEKTDIGTYDKNLIKSCTLQIKKDGTFQFNKGYGFLYDSIGDWSPRKPGFEEWNWFVFKKKSNIDGVSNIDCQVGGAWLGSDNNDIILNSLTPEPNKEPIYKLFMKKIN